MEEKLEILLKHIYCFKDDKSSIEVYMIEDEDNSKFNVVCNVRYPNKNNIAMNNFDTYEDALVSYTTVCGWAKKCIESDKLLNVFEMCDLRVY